MPAGNMASGVNHHHQGRTDGQGRDHSGATDNDRAANRKDEKERPDEFSKVFVHGLWSVDGYFRRPYDRFQLLSAQRARRNRRSSRFDTSCAAGTLSHKATIQYTRQATAAGTNTAPSLSARRA